MLLVFGGKLSVSGSLLLLLVILRFVDIGNAGTTSTFIRSEWPSADIPLDNEAFAIPKGHNAPQQKSSSTEAQNCISSDNIASNSCLEEVLPFKQYLHRYSTPYMASKSSNPLWYAIRRASAHIIVLSSYSPFGNFSFLSDGKHSFQGGTAFSEHLTLNPYRPSMQDTYWDPQPEYSAFREASYGHSTLEIKNRTHAFYHWNRNDDGKKTPTDSVIFRNQY
ncbi:Iron/zinc purple acid phosphatase-like C-terminal domain, partial [Dillenia turbinata]